MDYASVASSIYDPQLQSEETTLTRTKDANIADLDSEQKDIDPLYDKAANNLFKVRNQEGAKQDLLYSSSLSGQKSGLLGNQQRILGEDLSSDITDNENARQKAFQKIADRRKSYLDDFTAGISSLVSKYAGLKNQYISDRQAEDRQRAFEADQNAKNRAATLAASASYGSGGGGGSSDSGGAGNPANYNADQIFGLIHQIRNDKATYHASWGQIADILKKQGIDTRHGSAADKALNKYFGQG